jgi:DNA-nicking Smr family endonuclease
MPERERRQPRAASRRADEAQVLADSLAFDAHDLDVESGDELAFRREGVAESSLRRLRRGEYAVRDELDLHGMTQDEARARARPLPRGGRPPWPPLRAHHPRQGARLGPPWPCPQVGRQPVARRHGDVQAFCSARRNDGGTGALYVLLGGPR